MGIDCNKDFCEQSSSGYSFLIFVYTFFCYFGLGICVADDDLGSCFLEILGLYIYIDILWSLLFYFGYCFNVLTAAENKLTKEEQVYFGTSSTFTSCTLLTISDY